MRVVILVLFLCGISALISYHVAERKSTGIVESYLKSQVTRIDSIIIALDVIDKKLVTIADESGQIAKKATETGDRI